MEVNTIQLAAGLLGLVSIVGGTIIVLRYGMTSKALHSLEKSEGIVSGRTKTAAADIAGYRGAFLLIGVAVALAFALLLVSWTQMQRPVFYADSGPLYEDVFIVEQPRTIERSNPTPPAPDRPEQTPPEVLPEDTGVPETIPEQIEISEEPDAVNFHSDGSEAEVPVFRPAVAERPEEDILFIIVEEMPRFPGCEDQAGTRAERQVCAEEKLLQFIHKHVKYPSFAREMGMEGKVFVSFVVEKDGSVSNVEVLRDFGAGSGAEATRVVNLMNEMGLRWAPGKQRGVPVRVKFTLPVSFKLQ